MRTRVFFAWACSIVFAGLGLGQNRLLTSGVATSFTLPAISGPTLFSGDFGFRVVTPQDASRLEVRVTMPSSAQYALGLKFGSDFQGGRFDADHGGLGNVSTVTVTPSSSPPLRAGTYYIGISILTAPGSISGSITATVSTGRPSLAVASTFDFGSVAVGQSKDQNLTIQNTGTQTLNVTSLNSSSTQFQVISPATPFAVASSGQQAVAIRFQPSAAGARTGTLTIASNDPARPTVTVSLTGQGSATPLPTISSVVNGASFSAGIASGSWITIRGTNLSTNTRVWGGDDFQNGRLPLSLDGVSVKVNSRDAPVYFISPTQINALAPSDATRGAVNVTVNNALGTSAAATATYQQYAPALFAFDPQNRTYPAAVHLDGTFVGPPNLFGAAATTLPAQPGGRILLFGTGFGATTPAVDPLVQFSGAAPLTTPNDLRILVGNVAATVEFAGLVGNGLYQFNIVVPTVTDGDQALVTEIGGVRSQSTLRLNIRRPPPIPDITRVSPTDFVWGQDTSVTITGTNLTGATRVELSDPSGVRIASVNATSATSVSFRLTVEGGAAEGERTLTVVTTGARSNALPIAIRKGAISLTEFLPPIIYPDRVYSSIFSRNSSERVQFLVPGVDLAGVQNASIAPSEGIRLQRASPNSSAVAGWLFVDAGAALGTRRFTATSPAGTTNEVTFEVRAAPSTAPVISNVQLEAPSTSTFSINYRGRLTFTDSDADIRSGTTGAFIRVTELGGDLASSVQTLDMTGSFLDKAAQTSGTIDISFTKNATLIGRFSGPNRVAVTLVDSANNPSNTVIVTVPSWIVPLL